LFPRIKDPDKIIYLDGSGRMGKVALRGVENFESMGREAYLVSDGATPAPIKLDTFIPFSSSGEKKTIIEDTRVAKKLGLSTNAFTSYDNSKLAKIVDNRAKITGRGLGEEEIKKLMGVHTPLLVLGSGPEVCSLALIDCLSYAVAQSRNPRQFVDNMDRALYECIVYVGDVHRDLVRKPQQKILKELINGIAYNVKDVHFTGTKYSTIVGEMSGIRWLHGIYVRHERRTKTVDSTNIPKHIEPSTGLVAISARGESDFTNAMVDKYQAAGCKTYGLTMEEDSTFAKKIGPERLLVSPESPELSLNKNNSIDFSGVITLITLDCALMEVMNCLGRTEKQAALIHSPWT
jgi:D-arabinose 5-phosphate isomerase GutQ